MSTALVLAASQLYAGQQPPRQPEAAAPPTFRVHVDAVELDAVVTDALGNPVTDLAARDFELIEDGTPQTISSCSIVTIPIDQRESTRSAPAVEPDVETNDGDEGRLYVIAFDSMSPDETLRTRLLLHRFLDRYFRPNDLAAVVYLGRANQSKAQPFTSRRRLVLEAIDAFSGDFLPGPVLPPDIASDPAFAQPTNGLPRPEVSTEKIEAILRLRDAMASLRKLVESAAAVRGRQKSLLMFSHGISADVVRILNYKGGVLRLEEEDLHAAVTAATRGNVTIYPIDPRGITPDGTLADDPEATPPDPEARIEDVIARVDARMNVRELAKATGGFAVTDSNNFDAAFGRIVRENSSYYVLTFTSTNDRRDGHYRKLELRVRRPGVTVRARGGYVAPLGEERPQAPVAGASALSPATTDALGSAVAATGLPIRVFAAPYRAGPREARVLLAAEIGAAGLGLAEENGAFVGTLELGYLAVDSRNHIVPGERFTWKLSLKPETYARAVREGVRVLAEATLAPGRYQLHVAAGNRDGRAGSVLYDLDVPDFARAPLTMSGVSVTSMLTSGITTLRTGPSVRDVLPGPITTVREFPFGDRLALYAEVYENDGGNTTQDVAVTAVLRDEDGRVVPADAAPHSLTTLQGQTGGYAFTAELPLDAVEPGRYVIHVEAARPGGRTTISRDLPIRVTD